MYDVAVVGAGVTGASIARELARYDIQVVVIERENDVANGTTKANSAIIHAGYDAREGTLMAKYNVLGNGLYEEVCEELSVPFRRCGSLVLAFSEKEKEHLEFLLERGRRNGVSKLKIITRDELRGMEPNISRKAVAALYAETAGIVGPWELTIAMMENAVDNGVHLELNQEVIDIDRKDGGYRIFTSGGCHSGGRVTEKRKQARKQKDAGRHHGG